MLARGQSVFLCVGRAFLRLAHGSFHRGRLGLRARDGTSGVAQAGEAHSDGGRRVPRGPVVRFQVSDVRGLTAGAAAA